MKALVIILGLFCVALTFGFYKRHTSATEELNKVVKDQVTLSNKVDELATRLVLTNGTNETARSNLVYLVDRRTLEVVGLSNRLVQTRLLLKQAQSETQEAQLALQARAEQMGSSEAQREELTRQLQALTGAQKRLADANQKLAEVTTDRELWALEAQRLRVEMAEMQAKLENLSFLRIQLAKVEDEQEVKRRYGQHRVPAASDRRVQLELQEDDTVRVVKSSEPKR